MTNRRRFNARFLIRRRCQGRLKRSIQLLAFSHHLNITTYEQIEEKARPKTVQVRYPRQESLVRSSCLWREEISFELVLEV